jgi:DNA-binding winged helix-turn-helix (wHTH) protein
MAISFYRFGAFRVDLQARELFENEQRVDLPLSTVDCLIHLIRHRDRPIGRDELAAAVWGRADVSEVSLTHAIMRLRRVLGDDGQAQRCIRTVPRHGYRWVMEVESGEAEDAAAPVAETPQPLPQPPVTQAPRRPPRLRRLFALAAVVLALAGALGWAWQRAQQHPDAAVALPKDSAVVLPAAVEAAPDGAWLRLGLMDLIGARLRQGGLAVAPNESVLALVDAHGGKDDPAALPAAVRVRPQAAAVNGGWRMRLDASVDGRALDIDAGGPDPVRAARAAADELLIKLGRTPPHDEGGDAALAEAELRHRVNAAVLAGQLDVARQLIREAAPALQASPEIALGEAKVEFFAGEYEASRERVVQLLDRLPQQQVELRARALDLLGATWFRQGRLDEADRAYAEAIRLMQDGHAPTILAKAYLGSGGVASQRVELERAASDYGRARTLLELGNDAFGVAAVDLNLGLNAMQRGQPAAALALLRSANARFEKFAAGDALAATQVALTGAELALLDNEQALTLSARFASDDALAGNRRQRWELAQARAEVLFAVGRLAEADVLLARILDASDARQDAMLRAQATALAAAIALERGEPDKAAELAAAALTPALQTRSREDYASAWIVRVRALRRSDVAAARAELARMRAWSEAAPQPFDRIRVRVAEAEQAEAEGHLDAALEADAAAMAEAATRAIPAEMVLVGEGYVRRLLAARRIDAAVAVNGRIAPWADRDLRAALSQARIYAALGRFGAVQVARQRIGQLAGERALPADLAR